MNPNDITAEVIDIVYEAFTNPKKTNEEIEFITTQISHGAPIMDLGCGTGRHTIPLAKRGYDVIAVDGSKEMLMRLLGKLAKDDVQAVVLHSDIMKVDKFDQRFGGVICFWNAFCEMALTEDQAEHILKLVYDSMLDGGKLIIEININTDRLRPEDTEFESKVTKDQKTYITTFKVKDFDPDKNITTSVEHIDIMHDKSILSQLESTSKMRWWKKSDLEILCKKTGFSSVEFFGNDFMEHKYSSEGLIIVAVK